MTHLDEERTQALLHGELLAEDAEAARAHLKECADCRRRLAEAEEDAVVVRALLRRLDHPGPVVAVESLAARARGFGGHRLRRAAVILLALGGAGAAYAIPGSPVRDWVTAVAGWVQGRSDNPRPPADVSQPGKPALAGVSVVPGPRFVIQFTAVQSGGVARVSLTQDAEIVVQGPVGAATFTSGEGRLTILNTGSTADFDVLVPQSAPWVEIRVGNLRVLLKEGARITTAVSDPSAPYLLPLGSNGGIP